MVALRSSLVAVLGLLVSNAVTTSIKEWESLSGRTEEEIQQFIVAMGPKIVGALPPPQPIADVSMKLVNTKEHAYRPPRKVDIRGPCPGMNTLANHGYMSRTGVATPAEIVDSVQLGFNMGWDVGTFITYASLLVEGNPLTNLLSIGRHSDLTGPNPEGFPRALVGGIATHGPFEGDTSQARADFYWGDHVVYNDTVYQSFIDACDKYGDGEYNLTSAAEIRKMRYWHSRNTNPSFTFDVPRYATAYAESTFPLGYFNDGRRIKEGKFMNCRDAQTFYEHGRMPDDFYRREGSFGMKEVFDTIKEYKKITQVEAGRNIGVGTFIKTYPELQSLLDADGNCAMYQYFIRATVDLYPNPTGVLRDSLRQNAKNMYLPLTGDPLCPELFPYGQ